VSSKDLHPQMPWCERGGNLIPEELSERGCQQLGGGKVVQAGSSETPREIIKESQKKGLAYFNKKLSTKTT